MLSARYVIMMNIHQEPYMCNANECNVLAMITSDITVLRNPKTKRDKQQNGRMITPEYLRVITKRKAIAQRSQGCAKCLAADDSRSRAAYGLERHGRHDRILSVCTTTDGGGIVQFEVDKVKSRIGVLVKDIVFEEHPVSACPDRLSPQQLGEHVPLL
jgi:hypothetical protein